LIKVILAFVGCGSLFIPHGFFDHVEDFHFILSSSQSAPIGGRHLRAPWISS
jgi:hypothetical protein